MSKAIQTYLVGETYPPEEHILRDLALEIETHDTGRAEVQAPISSHICSQNGVVHAGVLATLVDVVGGILAVQAISPDWLSTSNMSLMTTRDIRSGRVSGQGRIVRCGRTSVVVEVDIYNEVNRSADKLLPAGAAMITYSRLASDGRALVNKSKDNIHQAVQFLLGITPLLQPLVEKAGIQIINSTRGRLRINMTTYVRNSLNSLQGGIIAFMADLAGSMALTTCRGIAWQTRDLTIHYMTPGIIGPFETKTEILRSDSQHALVRIEVLDRGDDDRLMAVIFSDCDQVNT